MSIIALNVMNVIKRRLLENDIEDVANGLVVEPPSALSVLYRQPTNNVQA